jgi:hypothetical protein
LLDEQIKKSCLNNDLVTENIQLQQTFGQPPNQNGDLLHMTMPKESLRTIHSFKPFLQTSTADEKLALLKNSSILKL